MYAHHQLNHDTDVHTIHVPSASTAAVPSAELTCLHLKLPAAGVRVAVKYVATPPTCCTFCMCTFRLFGRGIQKVVICDQCSIPGSIQLLIII